MSIATQSYRFADRWKDLPLAIELAAAQLGNYSPLELLAMLDQHASFSNPRPHGVASRHETLLATIDWSYRLLSQKRGDRLPPGFSLCQNSFDSEDVVHIGEAVGLDTIDVITGLGGLVAKSLLSAESMGLVCVTDNSTAPAITPPRNVAPIRQMP